MGEAADRGITRCQTHNRNQKHERADLLAKARASSARAGKAEKGAGREDRAIETVIGIAIVTAWVLPKSILTS